jgi:heme exporter protein D
MECGMITATISDGVYALLITGGLFTLVAVAMTFRALWPTRLRSWRHHRRLKRQVIAELERRQKEQANRVKGTGGSRHDEAFRRYLEIQHSLEAARRM